MGGVAGVLNGVYHRSIACTACADPNIKTQQGEVKMARYSQPQTAYSREVN